MARPYAIIAVTLKPTTVVRVAAIQPKPYIAPRVLLHFTVTDASRGRTMSILISNTFLSALAACSTKAGLYRAGYSRPADTEPDASPRAVGRAFHTLFANAIAGEILDPIATNTARVLLDENRLWSVFNAWTARPAYQEYEIFAVEQPFEVPLFGDYAYHGIFDMVVRERATGSVLIWEEKTVRQVRANWHRHYLRNPQLISYAWALEQMHPGLTVEGAVVNLVQATPPPSGNRACPEHKPATYAECGSRHLKMAIQHFDISPDDKADWLADVEALLLGRDIGPDGFDLKLLPREGRFSGACRTCDYSEWCLNANRNPVLLDGLLERREKTLV